MCTLCPNCWQLLVWTSAKRKRKERKWSRPLKRKRDKSNKEEKESLLQGKKQQTNGGGDGYTFPGLLVFIFRNATSM